MCAGTDGRCQGGSGSRLQWLCCTLPLLRPQRLTLTWASTLCAPNFTVI